MNLIQSVSTIIAVLLVDTLTLGLSVAAGQPDYQVYIVNPPISNQAIRPRRPLPSTCEPGTKLQVMACRGEYEPASFIVETQRTLREVRVEVGTLRSTSGAIPPSAVDVRVVAPCFRRITDWPGSLNWVLLHDPNLLVIRNEALPEAREEGASPVAKAYTKTMHFTREPVDTPTLQPAHIQRRQQFWLTVHVPENALADIYRAPVKIIPKNAPPQELTLELTVPDFDLLPPKFEYSVYYPTWIEGGGLKPDNPQKYAVVSEQQYLSELRNMVRHGCTNPTIYSGPVLNEDGKLDFAILERILDLREQAGMRGGALYLLHGGPVMIAARPLTPEEREGNVRWMREIVTWARQRGYSDVYLMGMDEATGEKMRAQRESLSSIHEGGGRVFVANYGDFYELAGDLLDLPILLHPVHQELDKLSMMPAATFLDYPESVQQASDPGHVLQPRYQEIIRGVHDNGFRIYTYMDLLAGRPLPEQHRRLRGIGLWKAGLDGTMTWAYTHITQARHSEAGPLDWSSIFSFVLRADEAPLDTLSWEAYREGYDDARYLATLQDALQQAKNAGRHPELATDTEMWLEDVTMDADLDAWRREMARRTEALLDP